MSAHSYSASGRRLTEKDVALVVGLLERVNAKQRLDSAEQAAALVEASRPSASPTHHLFGELWDAKKAQRWALLERAREIVISVRVTFAEMPNDPVRAFPVVIAEGKRGFYPMTQMVADKRVDLMSEVIEAAKADAVTWTKRWAHLKAVATLIPIFSAIGKVAKTKPTKLAPKRAGR